AAALDPVQELTSGVPVPVGPRAGGKAHDADVGAVRSLHRPSQPDLAGEPAAVTRLELALARSPQVHTLPPPARNDTVPEPRETHAMTTTAGPLALVGGDELHPGNEEQDRVLVAAAGAGPAFVLATAAARQHPELAVANARAWFGELGLEVEELPATRRSDAGRPETVQRARAGRLF